MFLLGSMTLDGEICNVQRACAGFDCLHTVEISAVTVAYGDEGIMEPKVFRWELCCSSTHMLACNAWVSCLMFLFAGLGPGITSAAHMQHLH